MKGVWTWLVLEAEGVGGYPAKVYGGSEKTHCCAIASHLREIRRLDSCAQRLSAQRLSAPKFALKSAPMHLNVQAILLVHVACSISGIWSLVLAAPGLSKGRWSGHRFLLLQIGRLGNPPFLILVHGQ